MKLKEWGLTSKRNSGIHTRKDYKRRRQDGMAKSLGVDDDMGSAEGNDSDSTMREASRGPPPHQSNSLSLSENLEAELLSRRSLAQPESVDSVPIDTNIMLYDGNGEYVLKD